MTPVVLMAGGRGLRLHPLTEKTPKPLLHVGTKPILETIIDGFAAQGFSQFHLCVNYRAELIEKYFVEMHKELKWGYEIPYMVTGILNKHPRSAMALMNNPNGQSFGDFYVELSSEAEV